MQQTDYSFINKDDERIGQYATKRKAEQMAKMLSNLPQYVCLTTTYRDLKPRLCWTIVYGKQEKRYY